MRTLVFAVATVFLACNEAFAQSHATHNLQRAKTLITTPTFDGGARSCASQYSTMWNLDGLNYRSPTGLYYNPRTGAVCPGQAAAACF
jgi:hypothetical protein